MQHETSENDLIKTSQCSGKAFAVGVGGIAEL
jgi:hypothetical protein